MGFEIPIRMQCTDGIRKFFGDIPICTEPQKFGIITENDECNIAPWL